MSFWYFVLHQNTETELLCFLIKVLIFCVYLTHIIVFECLALCLIKKAAHNVKFFGELSLLQKLSLICRNPPLLRDLLTHLKQLVYELVCVDAKKN